MMLKNAYVPYGAYYSTPFCRWQGGLAGFHSVELAATVAREWLAERGIEAGLFDSVILGTTVPQKSAFYGAPWLAGMIGAANITGPTIAQACATSARVIASAAMEVELGTKQCVFGVTCDRTSNGPHLYYPAPDAPGGRGHAEDWVWDAFNRDPFAKNAMIETAEKVAKAEKVTREEQDEITALRYEQYADALANDRAFQKRYLRAVTVGRKRDARQLAEDEGVHPSTRESLSALRPVMEGGSVTFGTQTHPADGNAAIVVCSQARAKELSKDDKVQVRILGYAEARTDVGMMPKAVVPAARAVLERVGVSASDLKAIKTHNPFAVNDVLMSRELGIAPERINRYGSPLVYGHPQGPTGTRLVIELIEELVQAGGGTGLFSGCAAGDTAMSLAIQVG